MGSRPEFWKTAAALIAILALGLGLRVYQLSAESPWCDEALTLAHLPAPSLRVFLQDAYADDPIPQLAPLYFLLEYCWSRCFGASTVALRMLSVMLGMGTIGLAFALGRRLYGTPAGLVAAWGAAVCLPLIYYAQEIRFYALFIFLATVSLWAFIAALQSDSRGAWRLHFLSNALLLWTHSFAPLLYVAEGAFLLCCRRRYVIRWTLLHFALLALFAAWAISSVQYDMGTHSQGYQGAPGTIRDAANAFLVYAGGRFAKEDPSPYLPWGLSFDRWILGVLGIVALFMAGRAAPNPDGIAGARWKERDSTIFLFLLLLAPLATLFIAAQIWRPCFLPRYTLYSALAWPLLMGGALPRIPWRSLRIALGVFFIAAYGYQNLALPRPFRADYQSAARIIREESAPGSRIHLLKPFNAKGMLCRFDWPESQYAVFEGFPEMCEDTASAAHAGTMVWAVFYRWDRTADFETALAAQGLSLRRIPLGGMPPLLLYRVTRNASPPAQSSP